MNFFSSDFNHEWSWKFFRTGLKYLDLSNKIQRMGFKFLNFPKPKIEQNDFECQWNIDYDSYAVDCLSSGHVCHVRTMLYVRFSICQRVFYLITVVVCTDWTTSEYDGGGVRWWVTSGIEIFVNWLTGTFEHFRKILCGMIEIPYVFTKTT